jgi:glutathione S-transferase
VTADRLHAICDYLNAEFGGFRLLADDGAARWQALATIAIANGDLEAQIMRRAELLRSDKERSNDFIAKMRGPRVPLLRGAGEALCRPSAAHSIWRRSRPAVACGYDDWRYGPDWRGAAPKLAAW